MSVNFFDAGCQSPVLNDELFGLCDDQNGTKAYVTLADPLHWNATVENPGRKDVQFTAIDSCIRIYRENGELERSCDGMLAYTDNLIFVELKNVRTAWIEGGIEQLEQTIKEFDKHHGLSGFRHKRAFVSNRKHRSFEVLDTELKRRFFDQYRVRINVCATIKINQ